MGSAGNEKWTRGVVDCADVTRRHGIPAAAGNKTNAQTIALTNDLQLMAGILAEQSESSFAPNHSF
jgi:hypothetical protein